jgi:hypothetical protein
MWEDILIKDKSLAAQRFKTMLSTELSKAGMPIKLLREILTGLSRKELLHYGKMVEVMKPELIKKIVDLWVKYREIIGDRVKSGMNTVREEDFNQATEEEITQLRKYLLHLLETKNL